MSVIQILSDDDDFDIYEDLPDINPPKAKPKQNSDDTELLKKRISQLLADVETLRKSNKSLMELNRNLSCNISVLFKTAVAEIKRKEEVIDNLRRERDNIIFRRSGQKQTEDASKPLNLSVDIKSLKENLQNQIDRQRAKETCVSEPEIIQQVSKQPGESSQKKKHQQVSKQPGESSHKKKHQQVSKQPGESSHKKEQQGVENLLTVDGRDHTSPEAEVLNTIKAVPKKRKVIEHPNVNKASPIDKTESLPVSEQVLGDSKIQGIQLNNESERRQVLCKSPSARKGCSPNLQKANPYAKMNRGPFPDKLIKRSNSSHQNKSEGSHLSICVKTSNAVKSESDTTILKIDDNSQSTSAHSIIDKSLRDHDLKNSVYEAERDFLPVETKAKESTELRSESVKISSPVTTKLSLSPKETEIIRKQGNEVNEQNLVNDVAFNHSSHVMSKGQEDSEDKDPMVNSALVLLSSVASSMLDMPKENTEEILAPVQHVLKKEDATPLAPSTSSTLKPNALTEEFEPTITLLPPLSAEECAPLPPPPSTFQETPAPENNCNPVATSQPPLPAEETELPPPLPITNNEPEPIVPFQPPLPREDPVPLPPLPLSTPPPTPSKNFPIIQESPISLKGTGQAKDDDVYESLSKLQSAQNGVKETLKGSTSLVSIMNPKQTSAASGAWSDENLHMQCPFKPRRRAKAIIVVEDTTDVKTQLPLHSSRSIKIETNSKLNKSPDKYKRLPLKKSEFHENRLIPDFRSYQSQRSMYSSRHFSSFKSFAHFPERRSPSELLNGRSGRIDRISHQDKVRIRLHDRRSRSLSPQRNKIGQHGYRTKNIQRGSARDIMRILTNDHGGKSNKIQEAKKQKSLSPRKKLSTQKKREDQTVKRKMVELFGESSPEPEEKMSRCKDSKSTNAVSAAEEDTFNQQKSSSEEIHFRSKSASQTNKIDPDGDIVVVKRRPRSNIRLGNSEDASPTGRTDANNPIISSASFTQKIDQNSLNVKSTQDEQEASRSTLARHLSTTPLSSRDCGSKRSNSDDDLIDELWENDSRKPPKKVTKQKPAKRQKLT